VRILHCTLDYAPRAAGGAEHQAQLQAEELSRRGHDVHVVCPRQGRERSGIVGGVRVHRLWRVNRRPFQTMTCCASLAWFLVRYARSFDVIHVHLADVRADVATLVCRPLRRPVYVKIAAGGPRGEIGKQRRISALTRYHGLRHAACVQAISREIAAQLAGLGIDSARIAAIPNGFDPAVFRPASDSERSALRQTLGLPLDRPIVLFVGRFARYKGLADLLGIWPAIAARFDAECVLSGFVAADDPYPIPNGIHGVTVREWTSRPELLYRAADLFVLPSHVEGMSNALLEAMACGLPAVATGVGAAPEMVDDGVDGVLVPAGDRDALARALELLLADPDLRHTYGGRASDSVRSRYSLSGVVDRIEARYAVITAR
jgi:glycosyltransferase involved in cell wall biosynthesis